MTAQIRHIHIPTTTSLALMISNDNDEQIICSTRSSIFGIDQSSLYGLVAHNGLEYTERELTGKEYAQQDGGYISGNRKKMRRITLVLKKHSIGRDNRYRPERFFSSKGLYTIYSASMMKEQHKELNDSEYRPLTNRMISGYLEHIERVGNPGTNAPTVVQVTFLCPDAYFSDGQDDIKQHFFGGISGGMQYKDNKAQYSTDKKLIQYERLSFVKTAYIENMGSVSTGFVATIITTSSVSQFYIKVNGETAQFGDIPKDSTLVIDTNKRTVTLNGANAYSLSKNRVFPLLKPGRNEIELSTITGSACIKFTAKHEGVF